MTMHIQQERVTTITALATSVTTLVC